jgi:hypothetical protein
MASENKVQRSKHKAPNLGGLGGIQTLIRSLQDFYALDYITSPYHL